ncbi:MAG: anti-sigma factor antagonist [Deltaproteobacteria bacterium]|nr:MAG: anti-sigma factor antagonist [Deltaproteobacteria bacterium]RLA99108.1 MAG: anti-sigma factor antagonist [Deltaproteobacteria bacterium]
MEIQVEKRGDVLVVKPLDKRLDALIASEFKDRVLQCIDEEKVKKVVLDLSKVEFVDSSGLGAIVSILKHVIREGRLVLCSLQKAVDELMGLTRLYRIFETAKDVKEALEVIAR